MKWRNPIRKTCPTKRFWAYIKSMKRDPLGIVTLKHNGSDTNNSKMKAKILIDQFESDVTSLDERSDVSIGESPYPAVDNLRPVNVLYINDLEDGITSRLRLFADDTLLYAIIELQKDSDQLRHDLNALETWAGT